MNLSLNILMIASLSSSMFASTANAEWLQVDSNQFVIYGDQSEQDLTRFAERLELFHGAMAYRFNVQQAKPSPSNRVTIYVVSSRAKVRKLADSSNRGLVGFYVPRAGSTTAVIPKLDRAYSEFDLSPETVLFHEYAHHFMYGITARAFPPWFVEGFAEFFAAVKFLPDGGVGLGAPATHRANELVYGRDVPIRRMLDMDGEPRSSKSSNDAFYGQSWLLFHYLMFATERSGQLAQYQTLLASGEPALDAAEGAFGDLDRLEKDMASYQNRKKLSYLVIDRKALTIGPISVRKLSQGEAVMIPTRIQSKIGVSHEEALELLPEAQRVAALYANDPAVLAALAEAECDAGNYDAAIGAADRAVAIDANEIEAQLQKGRALFRKVQAGDLPKESWQDVRNQYVRANKVENDHPIPLVQYYLTYREQGVPTTKVAVDGLEWAMTLAPFDASLRWMAAQQMISENRLSDAARTLGPLAYSPHPGEFTDRALQLLKDVQSKAGNEPSALND